MLEAGSSVRGSGQQLTRRGWSKVLGAVGGRGGGGGGGGWGARGIDVLSSCNVKAGGLSV